MFFYKETNNVAESNVAAAAAAAAMEPFSAETAKAADYKAATTTSEAPTAAATLTNFYAEATSETESDFAAADATAAMVIHKSTILRHSTEPDNGLVFHISTAAVAAEDTVFALVDAFVPSDNAVGLAHIYRSNVDTSRYDKQIYCYAFIIPPIISMRFKASSMPRNAFYYHYYCPLSEQYADEALPILMSRGAQQLVRLQLDSIEVREYLSFDNFNGKAHCTLLDHSNGAAHCTLLDNDADGYPIILISNINHAESMTNATTTFHPSATSVFDALFVIEEIFHFDADYDSTDFRHKMYPFLSLDASERSNDITNPKGTQDEDVLGEDISTGRNGEIAHGRSRKRIYRVPDSAYSRFYHLLGSFIIRKIIYVKTRCDISIAEHRKDFGLCHDLDNCALFMLSFEEQHRISRPTKHIVVIVMTTAIGICSDADVVGMLGIPVHSRLPNAGVANKKVLVKLCNIHDEPVSFDSSPNDVQYVNGEPGHDTDVLKDGEPYDKQFRRGRNRKLDREESARKRAETAREQYVRKQTVVDSIVENSRGMHFVRDAKSDGEKKQQSQSLYNFEKLTIPLLTENGEPSLDDGRLPLKVMAPNPDEIQDRNFLTSHYNGEQVKQARTVERMKQARTAELLDKHEAERFKEPAPAKLKVKFERSDVEDIMTYNEVWNSDSTIMETPLLAYHEVNTMKTLDQDAASIKHETQVDTKIQLPSFSHTMKLDKSSITRLYTTPVANIDRPIQNFDDHKKDLVTDDTLSNRTINEPLYYKEDNPACSSESQEDKDIFYWIHPLDPPKHVEINTGHLEMRPQGIEWKNGEQLYHPPDKIGSFESALKYQDGFDIDEGHVKDGTYTFDWDDEGTSNIDLSQNILSRKKKQLLSLAMKARLRSFRTDSKYNMMYGFQIRKDDEEVLELDVRNRNTKRRDSNALEMSQLMDYDIRTDKGEFHELTTSNNVPINDISYMSGDNESMINNYTVPHARSHKRHNILSYHLLRIMGACGYISMNHLRSESNVPDVLSQHWGSKNFYERLLKQTLRHIGNVDSPIQHDVLRDNEDKYDPAKQSIVYLKQKMGSVETRTLLVRQS